MQLLISFVRMRDTRPFEGDLAAKDGTISATIRQRDDGDEDERIANGCVAATKDCMDERKQCLRATFPCLGRDTARVYAQGLLDATKDSNASMTSLSPHGTNIVRSHASKNAQRLRLTRFDTGHRYREQQLSIADLWRKYDPESTGHIASHKVRALMEELNFPHAVSDFAVKFVVETTQANPHCSGDIPQAELRLAIPLYLALQQEQQYVDSQIDQLHLGNSDQIPIASLGALLSTINDGIPPTDRETDHILRQVCCEGGSMTLNSVLSRDDVWRAVAAWYPIVHRRHMIPAPSKTEGAVGGRRQRVREQAERHAAELERSLPHGAPIMTQTELRSLMTTLNDMKAVSDEDLDFVLHCANICTPLWIRPAEVPLMINACIILVV